MENDRGAGRDRFAVRPFFRRVTLAFSAWRENHGGRADTAHERGVVTGSAWNIDLAETQIVRALA